MVPATPTPCSPEIRHDPITKRSVIFSPSRGMRPSDFQRETLPSFTNNSNISCPFCMGHEKECAPEIFRVPADKGDSDWKIRVVENLYPALSRNYEDSSSQQVERRSDFVLHGFGIHDVVIEIPVHSVQLWDMEPVEIGEVFLACKHRIEQIMECSLIKYIQVFKNHGASSGASMSHSHSQILALPIVPPAVSSRLDGMKKYFEKTGKCNLCEFPAEELVIDLSVHFFSVVPFASSFPFEVWIIPRAHSSHFHEIDHEKASDLGGLLKLVLRKMSRMLSDPSFNFMVHTSPSQVEGSALAYSHWFCQIVPQLAGQGGFEIATGCCINPVFPEDAAKFFREIKL